MGDNTYCGRVSYGSVGMTYSTPSPLVMLLMNIRIALIPYNNTEVKAYKYWVLVFA